MPCCAKTSSPALPEISGEESDLFRPVPDELESDSKPGLPKIQPILPAPDDLHARAGVEERGRFAPREAGNGLPPLVDQLHAQDRVLPQAVRVEVQGCPRARVRKWRSRQLPVP